MTEYKKFLEEAAKRDHRRIGKVRPLSSLPSFPIDADLTYATGPRTVLLPRPLSRIRFLASSRHSHLQHPHRVHARASSLSYNLFTACTDAPLQQSEYRKRNYQEVITPNMFNSKLWETSGHWQNYADDMFKLDVEKETFALKPMNCPSHCLIFASRDRSYRELPIRMADFGVLHRNEASGALTGLTRVRRFQQDDAHHFCMPEQIEEEMDVCFAFLNEIYGTFGFEFNLKLSTRPEKFLGKVETWDEAEAVCYSSTSFFPSLRADPLSAFPDAFQVPRQVRPGQVERRPGRRCFLRPQDRHHDPRRPQAQAPVRDDPTRLPAPAAIRAQLPRC
jgi:threonyl-tRNA synthetase